MPKARLSCLIVLCGTLLGCGDDAAGGDAGGLPDARAPDARADSAGSDAAGTDGGETDGGEADAAGADAGGADAGSADAGGGDAAADGGGADAGGGDASTMDAGSPSDAGGACTLPPTMASPDECFQGCTADEDCVYELATCCCPCHMGGRSIAINRAYSGIWVERQRAMCEAMGLGDCRDVACLAVYLCPASGPTCVAGRCTTGGGAEL